MIELATQVVAAHVRQNSISVGDLGTLISDTHRALVSVGAPAPAEPPTALKPAVLIKKSVTPDYIISLEDGRKPKALKRYLRVQHGMTPDEYRAKWGLPADYPMVAPEYSEYRASHARAIGLGRKAAPEPTTVSEPAPVTPRKKIGLRFT